MDGPRWLPQRDWAKEPTSQAPHIPESKHWLNQSVREQWRQQERLEKWLRGELGQKHPSVR